MQTHIKVAGAAIARAAALFMACAVMSPALRANPTEAQASPQLATWVRQALAENPELRALAASVDAARARVSGSGRPLYNPELEFEYERTDINLATAAVSQALDWHGKQGARERVAEGQLTVVRAEYGALRERLAGELLTALVEYQGSRAAADLAARQVALLERFANVAHERGRAGDLGQVEVELARLAYVEGEMAAAGDRVAIAEAGDALYRITGVADVGDVDLPQVPAGTLPSSGPPDELAARHPDVRVALARAQVAGAAVRQADLDRRADPSIGIRGGREDDQALVGLSLSIPLQVRNDFRAEVDAARGESVQAAQTAMQITRRAQAELNAAQARYQVLLQAWRIWERKGQGILKSRLELLDRLWRVGELSTTDYLVQVKQSLETESAGLTLRRDLWQGWIAWVRAAGQVQAWLGLNSQGDEQ